MSAMPHTAALQAEPARTGVAPAVARATLEPGTGPRWPALPIGAVVLGLNLIQLNRAAPWRDEAASWVSGQRSPAELLSMLGQVDAVHGVYYFLLYGWQRLLGDSILSLRLLSALAVGITAALVFLLARELFGARCAPWAGLLAGVLPPATWAAGEARSFAVSCAATAAAMLALTIALRRGTGWTWTIWAGTAVVSIHLFLYSGLAFVGLLPTLFTLTARARRHALVAGLAVLTCCAPFAVAVIGQSGQLTWLAGHQVTVSEVLIEVFWRSDQLTGWVGSAALVIAVAVLLSALREPALRTSAWLVIGWLIGPVAVLAGLDLWRPLFLARYLTFTVGATALVLGFAIGRLPRGWLRGTATLLAVAALVPSFLQSREVYSKDTAFGAYQKLEQLARPGDGVLSLRTDTDQPFWAFRSRLGGLIDLSQGSDPAWRSSRLYPAPRPPGQVATTGGPDRIWLITKDKLSFTNLSAGTAAFEAVGYRAGPPTRLGGPLVAVLVERA